MRINSKIHIVGNRVILVPYKKLHVEKYHEWMQSPHLQELTASESLTLEEEYQMQQAWLTDGDKCTFIILDKGLMMEKNSEIEAMIGDTNLFLVDHEDRSLAEGEIMIAEPEYRGQKRGWEAMLLMFRYGVEALGITRYQVKIGLSNIPSINMFKKMHFLEVGKSEVFQEITLEVQVNEKWKVWLLENTKYYGLIPEVRKSEGMAQVIIREAKIYDCGQIVRLIEESKERQKRPIHPNINTLALEEDGWGSSSCFKSFIAETEGLIVGYVLLFYTYSTWEGPCVYMEDLYVTPACRRKGIASRLWKKLVETALDVQCCRCNLVLLESNAQAIAFCEKFGAVDLTKTEGWHYFRMNKDVMEAFLKTKKSIDGVVIRKASMEDYSGIRKLIQDLADFEKMSEGPQIDVKQLEEDSTGEIKFFEIFVAEEEDTLVGYVLFFYTYTWEGRGVYMEDLYVSPSHRSRGIGMALWRSVVQAGIDAGGSRCDFSVLDWNTSSIDIYKSKGAANLTEKKGFRTYRMVKDRMEKFVEE